ncbi:AsmA-like C-terminal region-containing protein [Balneolales bacterium ANBcel1]|nr:AsmA-like C-terminal region-containing protein [Balneolales bacterium ANBcel1]
MKKLALALGILLLVLIVLIGGLSLYLTDDRLRSMILPEVQELTGRDVQIERISYSLFRTFPRFGLIIEGVDVPDPVEDTFFRVDQLLVSVDLIPLIRSEIRVNRLEIDRPEFTYIVYEDGSTNIDPFLAEEPADIPDDPAEPGEIMDLDLSEIVITGAAFGMIDHSTGTTAMLSGLDIQSSLRFTDVLESTMDITLESLDVSFEGQQLVSGLGFHLTQTSILDLENEILNLLDGRLNLHGLGLTLEGSISDWGGGEPMVDLQIASASDDFGALLDLVPPDYEEFIAGLETGGGLDLSVSLSGRISEEDIPAFEAQASITDGFIQHSDVPERISGIRLSARADNTLVVIETFEASAGASRLSATAEIRDPLEETAVFTFNGTMNADLSTANRYVPLEEFDIRELAGLIDIRAVAEGMVWNPEEASFDVSATLSGGRIGHAELGRPVEDIEVEVNATRESVRISRATARSSDNYFSGTVQITSPLEPEIAAFEADGEITLDLATVGEYYPIDSDTLSMRGMISFSGSVAGLLETPEEATFSGLFELRDGFLSYHQIDQDIEDLTAVVRATDQTVTIEEARVRSGTNRFSLSGSVNRYMEDDASFDLTVNGLIALAEINAYYPVEEEFGLVMGGEIESGARLRGRIDDLEAVRLDGSVVASEVHMASPDLMLPLRELNGSLEFIGDDLHAESITFYFGESDYSISGRIRNYMAIMEEPGSAEPARFTGSFRSELFNADEFMDFEEPPEDFEPEPFEAVLPNLAGSFDAEIAVLQFFGMEATDIKGTIEMSPNHIGSDEVSVHIFDGTVHGDFRWDVFAADHTGITFNGELDKVRVQELFSQMDFGGQLQMAEHIRADFSATTEFYAEFDEYLEMDMAALFTTGDFGMEEARVAGHPVQVAIAELLGVNELRDLSLDSWTAKYHIEDGIMRLDDFNLTSRDIGLNLSGTQNLIEDELDYRAELILPGAWAGRIGGVLPGDAVDALRRDDGKLVIPATIRGTSENPRPGLDQERIRELVEEYLKERARDAGRDILEGILNRF